MGFDRYSLTPLAAEDATQGLPMGGLTAPSPYPALAASKTSLASFRPSIVVIVGVLTTMFSLTFLLLLYARHCKRAGEAAAGAGSALPMSSGDRRNSGVERAVVESLPVFRFGSLLGQKEGLECAVCLNRFEPTEALRLLPKCRHAFHVECIDVWLDAHATCPLCRVRVDPEDVLLLPPDPRSQPEPEKPRASKTGGGDGFGNPFGRRVSGRHSSAGEKSSRPLQIVVQRNEPPEPRSRLSVDLVPLRPAEPGLRKDGQLLPEERERFEHRIVVSNSETAQERWSDLRPSDLLFLRSGMIITESGRFSASRAARTSCSLSASARSVSEITGVSRFQPSSNGAHRRAAEERTMRRWLGFAAKRTAQWLGSRGGEPSSGYARA